MRIWFVSPNFPPEVNAPATRLYEHARTWLADGGSLDVITDVPNYPEGVVYPGYRNRYSFEYVDGIPVHRVPMYMAENKGSIKRILSYISFMLSVIFHACFVRHRPDVVVGTSPQFFAAIAGYVLSRITGVPFVLEIRDLWPESIVAVGAMRRNWVIRLFEKIEVGLYRRADHIVVVTRAFKNHIVGKGIDPERISFLPNGADLESFDRPLSDERLAQIRAEHGLEGKFVVSYIGTIGMAHRADVMLEAAERCTDPDIVFMVVGTGAEREALARRAEALALPNFRLVDKQPKEIINYFLAASDVSMVHLRRTPLFETVIPSKIFESMAMRRPIVLGVEGESRALVEEAGAGLCITPENVDELLAAVTYLKKDASLYGELARRGRDYVSTHYNRTHIARRYWSLLRDVADLPVTHQPEPAHLVAA